MGTLMVKSSPSVGESLFSSRDWQLFLFQKSTLLLSLAKKGQIFQTLSLSVVVQQKDH